MSNSTEGTNTNKERIMNHVLSFDRIPMSLDEIPGKSGKIPELTELRT